MHDMKKTLLLCFAVLTLSACVQEGSRTLPIQKVTSATRPHVGARVPVSVGKFDNRSSFMRGVFSNHEDRVGSQAQTILVTHLQQSQRFSVFDRSIQRETKQETDFNQQRQAIQGAAYVVTGDVTEFGRKDVGDRQLFGILGRGKTQLAYAKVNLNVVNTLTSEVVYSSQGAGEYSLSEREVIGFGSTAGYDATLNGKVLELAIREAVNNLVSSIDTGAWRPAL
jgi:curli biogenesis system outer membrane secretion channel CsgG